MRSNNGRNMGLEKLNTVEDNVTKLKYEILGISETMSSIAQTSRLDIEKIHKL